MTDKKFDLRTSEGGRGYIAHLFETQLKRHDFRTYIKERLAADFACALSEFIATMQPHGQHIDTVAKFKFDTLVEHSKRQERDIALLRAELNQICLYENSTVWHWQHDGEDFLESLTCPVVIPAAQLRELLSKKLTTDKMGKPFTYSSTQATNCAGCGKYKHTPLRVDGMDGYVCLTCIDTRLEELLAAESARDCVKDWDGCEQVADLPAVHEALEAFSGDPTGDAGVLVVKAVVDALAGGYIALTPAELQSGHDRVRWAEGLIRQLPEHHDGRNSWLMNYGQADKGGDGHE
jgi:hypothetical protein